MPGPELAGLWAAHRQFGPQVDGPLELVRTTNGWRATVGGFSAPVEVEGDTVRFSLPGERGEFRGRFENRDAARPVVRGHWIQPRNVRSFARMATPVTLEPADPGRWTGVVTSLPDELHLYLVFEQRDDGSLTAFLRNPEANIGRFYPIDRVVMAGDTVEFRDADGQTLLQGRYDPNFDRLSVYFPWNGGTYDFERADGASRFYPRPVDDPPYEYRSPPPGDGWDVARPEDVGMDTAPLVEMVRMIATTPIDAIGAPDIHGILVARHGKLVLEEYFHDYTRHELHGTRSASKSVTTTLVGIAAHEGTLTLDAPVYETMYGGAPPPDLDPRARRMTLEDLVTMTPGLACDDSDPDSPGGEDRMQNQEEQSDWFRYTLELPMAHEPGEHAAYCSASQNLAGGMLSRLSGEWLPDFYRDHFAGPLGAEHYAMNLAPDGEGYGGGGLYVLPRDFLKLGQLYLNDGTWRGRRLLDRGWAATATRTHFQIRDEGYGYGWWVFSYPWRGRELPAFYAGGNGGQYVIVVPELDLAVAIFGGNYNQRVMHVPKYEYVRDYVVSAVRPGT
jgi:CubicO group peptidase (beta-lactamase class C family)